MRCARQVNHRPVVSVLPRVWLVSCVTWETALGGVMSVLNVLPGVDTRVAGYERLIAPTALLDELPLSVAAAAGVARSRDEVRAVLDGSDDRLLVIAGPCSVHDPAAALEYAGRLTVLRDRYRDDLLVVMRVYFEKPRTVTGWKGLINDPGMDGGHDVHRGLRVARQLLLQLAALGLPAGCEWLDLITPQYISDTVTWGAIGARTAESQVHRQLASGLSMPVGFKNGTGGDIQVAVDACRASAAGHAFFGVTPAGTAAVVTTAGNPDTHVVLRGGQAGPNYGASHVSKALEHGRGRRAAAPADGRRQPRQQLEGSPPPAAGGGRRRGPGGGRRTRPDRGDAGELPARGQAGAGQPGHAHLRAERHRRLYRHRYDCRRPRWPGGRGPQPP